MFDAEPPARAVFLTDEAGKVLAWNPACAALFGLDGERILGNPVTTLFTPSGRDAWSAGWTALARQRQGAWLHVELMLEGRRPAPATLALSPQLGRAGEPACCAVSVSVDPDPGAANAQQVARTPLAAVVDALPGAFYVLNRDGRFVLWNRNMERITEMAPDELAAARAIDLLELDQRPLLEAGLRQAFEEGRDMKLEIDYLSKSGRELPFLLCGTRVRCDGGDYLFGVGVDIAERRARERQLRLRERALHAASNGIVITRLEGGQNAIEYANPAFERITGYPAAEILGADPRFMAAPGMDEDERARLRAAIAARAPARVELRNLRKNGELFWNELSITPVQDEHGAATHYIGVLNDVTAARLRTAHLEHEVNHDPLTGLANRNLLWDRLEQALHLAQRQKTLVATVLIDLDNFKAINDTHGHEAGDVVLKVVARRLQASVRDSDTVARMSGDEFVLVLSNQPTLRFTQRMVERVRASFAIPVSFNGREIPVGASVGVSLYPHDGASATELVRAADLAMYRGKGSGRNDVHFFSPHMKSSTDLKQHLELALRAALARDELFLLYQPSLAIRSGKVAGFEALLRWRHPQRGVLAPAHFLAEAEASGTIVEIGQRVLEQACAFAARLAAQGVDAVPVTVNVSQREYSQPGFLADLAERLARWRLPPHSLKLDLRLDGLVRNPAFGRELADQLHALGVDLSVDGFGSGLFDLGYLQRLAPSQVKLAHASAPGGADGAGAVTKTLIDIGHNLNMEVVGEAVETRPQLEFLKAHGCDQVQGTWFSEPLGAEEAQKMLAEHHVA